MTTYHKIYKDSYNHHFVGIYYEVWLKLISNILSDGHKIGRGNAVFSHSDNIIKTYSTAIYNPKVLERI